MPLIAVGKPLTTIGAVPATPFGPPAPTDTLQKYWAHAYVRAGWTGRWVSAPYLQPLHSSETVWPGRSTAEFMLNYGEIKREDRLAFEQWNNQQLLDLFVCIRVIPENGSPYITWVGTIPVEQLAIWGTRTTAFDTFPAGDQSFTAYGLEHVLERRRVPGARVRDNDTESETYKQAYTIGHAPPFNRRLRTGMQVPGNRSSARIEDSEGESSTYGFNGASEWTNKDIVEYLLYWSDPRREPGAPESEPTFTLAGQPRMLDWLDSLTSVVKQEHRNVRSIIEGLIPRNRGIGARLVWSVADDSAADGERGFPGGDVDLELFPMIDGPVGVSGVLLPGNVNREFIYLDTGIDKQAAVVARDTLATYDRIIVSGARVKSCFSAIMVSDVAATGTLAVSDSIGNGENVSIDGKDYVFHNSLADVDGYVLIGGTVSESLDNLVNAINLGPGAGTVYAASTTLHPSVTAAAGDGDSMVVTAKIKGPSGNSITTTEVLANGSWSGPTLTGGATGDYDDQPFAQLFAGSSSADETAFRLADAVAKKSSQFDLVYRRWSLPDDFDWKDNYGQRLNPSFDLNAYINTTANAPHLPTGHKFLRELPLLVAADGTGEPAYMKSFAVVQVKEDATELTYKIFKGKWIPAHDAPDGIAGGNFAPLDRGLSVELRYNPPETLVDKFSGFIATVAVETDTRPTVDLLLDTPGSGRNRILEIPVPDAEVWVVAAGTVIGVKDDGTLDLYSGVDIEGSRVVRDDTQRLRQVAAMAKAMYEKQRSTIEVKWVGLFLLHELGTLIEAVFENKVRSEVGSVVTQRNHDYVQGTTTIKTGHAELVFGRRP